MKVETALLERLGFRVSLSHGFSFFFFFFCVSFVFVSSGKAAMMEPTFSLLYLVLLALCIVGLQI